MILEEKQYFLRMNILEEGYDADEFSIFISKKIGKEDIDWPW